MSVMFFSGLYLRCFLTSGNPPVRHISFGRCPVRPEPSVHIHRVLTIGTAVSTCLGNTLSRLDWWWCDIADPLRPPPPCGGLARRTCPIQPRWWSCCLMMDSAPPRSYSTMVWARGSCRCRRSENLEKLEKNLEKRRAASG